MLKLFILLCVIQILTVNSANDICLKAYKKKLCLKLSVRNYDLCLFQQFNVFEMDAKFCVSNTKCVPKTSICSGFLITNTPCKF